LRATPFQRTRKIYPLTSVRFFWAFYVVFHHTAKIFLPVFTTGMFNRVPPSYLDGLLFWVPASLSFFFVLSGYVLSVVYLRDGKPVDKRKFWAARFARIYPLFFVTLVLDTPPLLFVKIHRNGLVLGLVKTAGVFGAHLLMLHGWYLQRLSGIDDANWSLSAETFFYLCFPAIGVLLWKLRGIWLWAVALGLYVGGQMLVFSVRSFPLVNPPFPLLHLSTFALGILLARWQALQQDDREAKPVGAWPTYGVLVLAVAGIMLSVKLAVTAAGHTQLFTGLLAPVFVGIIWALSSTDTPVSRLLCTSWLVALGNASFALYLIHFPMLHLFEYFHWETRPMLYPAYLVLCVGLSVLSFYYFETPARLWLLRRFHSRALETVEEALSSQ
jgi:peptidoglycan/LPS O-acetylase OafA/YrhL